MLRNGLTGGKEKDVEAIATPIATLFIPSSLGVARAPGNSLRPFPNKLALSKEELTQIRYFGYCEVTLRPGIRRYYIEPSPRLKN